jgi:DNA-binding MarR family transcriptional regulator
MSNADGLGRNVTGSLGYLLKHAHLQFDTAQSRALESFGLDPRSLGVLRVLASREPTSQQEVAHLLGVDRTTMVALLDSLEQQGIVSRRPSTGDRRRNVIELTSEGSDVYARAEATAKAVEKEFLAQLSPSDAEPFRNALHLIVVGR